LLKQARQQIESQDKDAPALKEQLQIKTHDMLKAQASAKSF
jgi:hypothetical protein